MSDGLHTTLALSLFSAMGSLPHRLYGRVLLVLFLYGRVARAVPAGAFVRRDSSGGDPISIWVPILVVVLVVGAVGVLVWTRRSVRRNLANRRTGAARPTRTVGASAGGPEIRELTAEQLVGPAASGPGAGQARRPGRTASQMSTRSLPAYMKEPGDQELVIYQGNPDTEDVVIVEEPENADAPPSAHPSFPLTPSQTPLLRIESNDMSITTSNPPSSAVRTSMETIPNSQESGTALLRDNQLSTMVLPEEPPNYEAGDHSHDENASNANVDARSSNVSSSGVTGTTSSADAPAAETTTPIRRGFRSLLHAMSNPASRTPFPVMHPTSPSQPRRSQGHTRDNSGHTVVSVGSDSSHSTEAARARRLSHRSHRPNQSSTGSAFNMTSSALRTLSRTRSNNTMNSNPLSSPSTLSLHSISSPLSHTLMRTEIAYPKSGPTPEQMKLISSRESFGKYAVPYGADAIAYAASSSRLNLSMPPPDFDAIAEGRRPQTGDSSGSSGENAGPAEPHSDDSDGSQEPISEVPRQESTVAPVAELEPKPESESQPEKGPELEQESQAQSGLVASGAPPASEPETSRALATEPTATVPPTSYKSALDSQPSRSESRASTASFATAAESMPPATPTTQEGSPPSTPRIAPAHLQEGTDLTITPAMVAAAVH